MKQQQHLFTNKMLRALLVPIIMEQLLNALMGTVDTMMVSNVGSAAISAVSLVDSINVLIIQAFSALAAGLSVPSILARRITRWQTNQPGRHFLL
jgi:Na+-driven multidrug efflux pump